MSKSLPEEKEKNVAFKRSVQRFRGKMQDVIFKKA
jgi:hypothetical protein